MKASRNRIGQLAVLIALTLAALGGAGRLLAQNASAPLVMLISGDYYSWDGSGALHQLTQWGYNHEPALSPDGSQIAYMSYAQITADAITKSGGIGGGELPSNIWLLAPVSANAQRVADQPPNASFYIQGKPDTAVVRSKPAWSPDGSKLVWSEFTLPNNSADQIVVYDMTAGVASTIVRATPDQAGVPIPAQVVWTPDGIIVWSTTAQAENSGSFSDSFLVYDPTGKLVQTIPAGDTPTHTISNFIPVTANGQSYLDVLYTDNTWTLVDPRTGGTQPVSSAPELYSPKGGDGAVTVSSSLNADRTLAIQIHDAKGAAVGQPINIGYDFDNVALSPDGTAVAYVPYNPALSSTENAVTIWKDGSTTRAPQVSSTSALTAFVWGPSEWRIPAGASATEAQTPAATQPASTPATLFSCPGAQPPRLQVGGQGRVVKGVDANNLRVSPSLQAAITGVIPPSGTFVVTTGPECHDGVVWWAVDVGNQGGWTAESRGTDYYLEPAG